MENLSAIGIFAALVLGAWVVNDMGLSGVFFNLHGLVLVMGGVFCAGLINYPFSQFMRGIGCLRDLFLPRPIPAADEVAGEIMRLAQMARAQGGMLALQNEGHGVLDGFLNRALLVAIAAREPVRIREILEADVRQMRILRQEDANFFRTLGTLAPMFGLLGTLLGIILVLRSMSDPLKVGPAMALAITASLYGISFSNLLCIPVAGHIRTRAMKETRAREVVVDGVIELMRAESLYLLELRMAAYAQGARPGAPATPLEGPS